VKYKHQLEQKVSPRAMTMVKSLKEKRKREGQTANRNQAEENGAIFEKLESQVYITNNLPI
jgi:hypothetical protein